MDRKEYGRGRAADIGENGGAESSTMLLRPNNGHGTEVEEKEEGTPLTRAVVILYV